MMGCPDAAVMVGWFAFLSIAVISMCRRRPILSVDLCAFVCYK